jgi:hypothetical protein
MIAVTGNHTGYSLDRSSICFSLLKYCDTDSLWGGHFRGDWFTPLVNGRNAPYKLMTHE